MNDSTEPVGLSSPSVVLAVPCGLVYAAAVGVHARTLGYPVLQFEHPAELYVIVLLVAAGAVPVYAFVRRRTVTPAIVLLANTYVWIAAESDPNAGPGDPYVGFVGLLPLAIGLMVALELVEWRIRERFLRATDST